MTMIYLFVALGIVVVVVIIFIAINIWVFRHTNRIQSYFIFATIAYVISGKVDTHQAAITSASVIDNDSYPFIMETMSHLGTYLIDLPDESDEVMNERLSKIFLILRDKVNSNVSNSKVDIVANKLLLSTLNSKYLRALNNPNPRIFAEDYPSIAGLYNEIQNMIDKTRKEFFFGRK
jgi:hypothetical protein